MASANQRFHHGTLVSRQMSHTRGACPAVERLFTQRGKVSRTPARIRVHSRLGQKEGDSLGRLDAPLAGAKKRESRDAPPDNGKKKARPKKVLSLREQFEKWDTEKTGYITAEMLQARAKRRGEQMSLEEAQAVIAESDVRGDGVLWFVEYKLAMYKAIAAAKEVETDRLRRLFVSLDEDRDGLLNADELQRLAEMLGDRLTRGEIVELMGSVKKRPSKGLTAPGKISFQQFLSLPLESRPVMQDAEEDPAVTELLLSPTGSAPLSGVVLRRAGPFITSAYGTRPDGSVIHRTSRRMRKQRSKIAAYTVKYDASEYTLPLLGPVRLSSATGQIKWWEGPPEGFNPSWWLAALLTVGSLYFIEGSAVKLVEVTVGASPGVRFWGKEVPFFIGSLLFDVGCWLLMVESLNTGYQQRLELWERVQRQELDPSLDGVWLDPDPARAGGGGAGTAAGAPLEYYGPYVQKPVWRWAGAEWRRLDFIGATIFTAGSLCYTGMTAPAVLQAAFPELRLQGETLPWVQEWAGLAGAVCFVAGSYCYWAEFNEGWSLAAYRPQRIAWWLNLFNLLGSLGFLLVAAGAFVPVAPATETVELLVGYFGGSLLFLASSYLMLLEVINPNDVEDDLEVFD